MLKTTCLAASNLQQIVSNVKLRERLRFNYVKNYVLNYVFHVVLMCSLWFRYAALSRYLKLIYANVTDQCCA